MWFKKKFIFLTLLFVSNISAEVSNYSKLIMLPYTSGIHIAVSMYTTASSFGAVGDGVTDDTDALVRAFYSGANLDLEGKKYLIDLNGAISPSGLMPRDNTIIEGNGAEIILKPNNLISYSMISLINSKNIKIYNLKLTGDVKKHIERNGGEWGMGFTFRGTKNCELHQVEANEMWGDGFYISAYGKETSEGGGIFNSSARANRRVGLTVIRCKNFIVKDCNFKDTGTIKHAFPAYGVVIEPNPDKYDSIDEIKLINIKTKNNQGGGIKLVPTYLDSSTDPNAVFNVSVEKFISKDDCNKEYWTCGGLQLVERLSRSNYGGLVKIKGFEIINLGPVGVSFLWERNEHSFLEVDAIDLRVDGVTQYDYHY